MTEPSPTWPSSEREAQRQIVQALRAAGWFVVVTSVNRPTRRQLRGLPDLVCFRAGHVLLIEVKNDFGRLRPSQEKFRRGVWPHLGPHLDYTVARTVWDVEQWV